MYVYVNLFILEFVCAMFVHLGDEQRGNTLNFGQLPLVVCKNFNFIHSLFRYYIHTQLLTVNIGKMADGSRVRHLNDQFHIC